MLEVQELPMPTSTSHNLRNLSEWEQGFRAYYHGAEYSHTYSASWRAGYLAALRDDYKENNRDVLKDD